MTLITGMIPTTYYPINRTPSSAFALTTFGMESGCCEKRAAGSHYDCPGCEPLFPGQSNTGKSASFNNSSKITWSRWLKPLQAVLDWLKHLVLGFWQDLKQIFSGQDPEKRPAKDKRPDS